MYFPHHQSLAPLSWLYVHFLFVLLATVCFVGVTATAMNSWQTPGVYECIGQNSPLKLVGFQQQCTQTPVE